MSATTNLGGPTESFQISLSPFRGLGEKKVTNKSRKFAVHTAGKFGSRGLRLSARAAILVL
jgi:hypothetical protein